jgi:anti-anti-sigma factor
MSSTPSANRLKTRSEGTVTVVGFVDHKILHNDTIRDVGDQLYHLVDQQGCKYLLLDFTHVDGFSSGALGKLINRKGKLNRVNGKLVLCNVAPHLTEIFRVTRLDRIMPLTPDVDAGLKEF